MPPRLVAYVATVVCACLLAFGLATMTSMSVALDAQTNVRSISDTVNANADSVGLVLRPGVTTVTVDITGTFSETLTFNVVGTDADPVACTPTGGGAAVSTATAVGKFVCPVTGWLQFNVVGSSYVSGAAIVRLQQGGDQP